MTQQHPITPPPELRRLWAQQAQRINPHDPVEWMQYVSEKATQWGADQELKACCEWLEQQTLCGHQDLLPSLRAARRPKPPSLKEQALLALNKLPPNRDCGVAHDTIRRALEQLPDHE